MIAALYVGMPADAAAGLRHVDLWDEARDARALCRPTSSCGASALPTLGAILAWFAA